MTDEEYYIKKYEIIEWNKCYLDPKYFISNYVYNLSPTSHRRMVLYPWQRNAIDLYNNHNLIVGNVSRQCGTTSSVLAYILWYCMFNSDKQIILAGSKFSHSISLKNDLMSGYHTLPDFLKTPLLTNNTRTVTFSNGVCIENLSVSSQAVKSRATSLVYIDNASFCNDQDLQYFISSAYPAIAKNGKIIITSCPNTISSEFYSIWKRATDHGIGNMGSNGFVPYQVTWRDVPGRDTEFKSRMLQNFDPTTWMREFECHFV